MVKRTPIGTQILHSAIAAFAASECVRIRKTLRDLVAQAIEMPCPLAFLGTTIAGEMDGIGFYAGANGGFESLLPPPELGPSLALGNGQRSFAESSR